MWVLDYNRQRAIDYLLPEIKKTLPSFEHWFGPYPFYEDGFKMVESPYIGMEHQSAVGYGNHFERGRYGSKRLTYWDLKTDRMVVHENAHEWFGNNITTKDPADSWIHEGFAGYAEELVIEDWYGKPAADTFFLARTTGRISNDRPIIGQYNIFEPMRGDVYLKGWALVRLIRTRMHNDEKFRQLLRALNSHFYHQTVTSAQIESFISKYSGIDFSKVFDLYLRTTQPITQTNNPHPPASASSQTPPHPQSDPPPGFSSAPVTVISSLPPNPGRSSGKQILSSPARSDDSGR